MNKVKHNEAAIKIQAQCRRRLAKNLVEQKRLERLKIRDAIKEERIEGNLADDFVMAKQAEDVALDDSFASDVSGDGLDQMEEYTDDYASKIELLKSVKKDRYDIGDDDVEIAESFDSHQSDDETDDKNSDGLNVTQYSHKQGDDDEVGITIKLPLRGTIK
jgi:hypothetical protein